MEDFDKQGRLNHSNFVCVIDPTGEIPSGHVFLPKMGCCTPSRVFLILVIAAGFDPTSEEVDLLDRDYTDGGIFVVSTVEKGRIKSSMRNLNCDNKAKFRHVLAYQMELGYDLALSPGDVVSMNPGFEAVLGVVTS